MARQLSADHFCHIGADIIADADGTPWLIEANCPPNLYAYTNDPDHPDEKAITPLIRAMLSDLVRLFVLPVVTNGVVPAVSPAPRSSTGTLSALIRQHNNLQRLHRLLMLRILCAHAHRKQANGSTCPRCAQKMETAMRFLGNRAHGRPWR